MLFSFGPYIKNELLCSLHLFDDACSQASDSFSLMHSISNICLKMLITGDGTIYGCACCGFA